VFRGGLGCSLVLPEGRLIKMSATTCRTQSSSRSEEMQEAVWVWMPLGALPVPLSFALSRAGSLSISCWLSLSLSRARSCSCSCAYFHFFAPFLSHSLSRCLLRALSLPRVFDVHARVCSPCVQTSMQRRRSVNAYLRTYETQSHMSSLRAQSQGQ
jgi:hypothetical protein